MKFASPRFTRCNCIHTNTVDRKTHPETAFAYCVATYQTALNTRWSQIINLLLSHEHRSTIT